VDAPVGVASSNHFSWIAVAVFVLVLCDAAITWMQLRSNNSRTLSTPNMLNMVALAVCSMIAIVRLTRQKGSRALRLLVVGGLFVVAAVTYGSMLLQSFDQQLYHQNFENALQYMGMRSLSFGEIIADCAVALPGLIIAFRQKAPRERSRVSLFGSEEPGA
jgi:drug/metabolite transporter superfamily protein YnfA